MILTKIKILFRIAFIKSIFYKLKKSKEKETRKNRLIVFYNWPFKNNPSSYQLEQSTSHTIETTIVQIFAISNVIIVCFWNETTSKSFDIHFKINIRTRNDRISIILIRWLIVSNLGFILGNTERIFGYYYDRET